MPPELKKRRSTRIVQAVPLAVTGVDALGRPFQERTSTLIINCHGARYQSKHYVLKNMWVTLEIPQPEPGSQPRALRGKVTWIQRPRTVRQLFQIAVELETPGNFWGIAFPPEDWFPPADSMHVDSRPTNSKTEAPGAIAAHAEPAAGSDTTHHAGQFSADNLHVMPPVSPVQEASQVPVELAREMNRLMVDAHQKLQAAAREAVNQAVTAETSLLIESLQGRITEAENAVQAAATRAAERGAELAAAKLNEAQAAAFSALRTELPNVLVPQIEKITQQLSEGLSKAGSVRFAAFDEKLQSALHIAHQTAHQTIEQLSRETTACLEKLHASLQRFETETDRRADAAHRGAEQASCEQVDTSAARQQELAIAEQRLHEQLSAVTADASDNWRVRLEADLALAGSRWEQTMETSIESAANRAAEHIEHRGQASVDQLERQWSTRAEQIRGSIESLGESAVRGAERDLASLRSDFEKETARALSLIAEMQQAINRGQEFSARLAGLSDSAFDDAQSRLHAIAAAEAEKFAKRTDDVIADAGKRIEPLLNTARKESVERMASEFEARIAPQLQRAAEVFDKLTAAEKKPEELLRVYQERLDQISEQSTDRAVARLNEDLAAAENEFQQKVNATQGTWLAELEKRAGEVQAAATDSLAKTAEWHQKHAESLAQTAFENRIEEASATLREKAGELSGLFAAELDHYSRSYVEHSQTQMDEAVKETFERARGLFSEIADTTMAAFTDEIQQGAHGQLDNFQKSLEQASLESRTQIEAEAQQIQASIRTEGNASFSDFQQRMAAAIENGVVTAGQQLEKQLEPALQTWRQITEQHSQQIHDNYERLGNESVDNYKQRLENVSNSWMVATVTTLDRQSQELVAGVAKSAEERLRDTCCQVFAGVGETLRLRLQEIASSLASQTFAPEKYSPAPPKN